MGIRLAVEQERQSQRHVRWAWISDACAYYIPAGPDALNKNTVFAWVRETSWAHLMPESLWWTDSD